MPTALIQEDKADIYKAIRTLIPWGVGIFQWDVDIWLQSIAQAFMLDCDISVDGNQSCHIVMVLFNLIKKLCFLHYDESLRYIQDAWNI